MKTKALLIPAGGPASLIEVDTGDDQLEELQELVGGYFEAVSGPGWVALVNEDGRYAGLPTNWAAGILARLAGWPSTDHLVGAVVFFGPPDQDGAVTDVATSLLDAATSIDMVVTT